MKPQIKIIKHENAFGPGYGVQFTVGVQTFKMDYCADTKHDAKWYAKMLKFAFDNLKKSPKTKSQNKKKK